MTGGFRSQKAINLEIVSKPYIHHDHMTCNYLPVWSHETNTRVISQRDFNFLHILNAHVIGSVDYA